MPGSAGDLEVGEARQHRLAADARVLECDRDLLVAAGELRGDDDALAPCGVPHAVTVAGLSLAWDHRAVCSWGRGRSGRRRSLLRLVGTLESVVPGPQRGP